ncbi:MAG: MFS transporter [Opitutales bacterium]
MSVPPGLWRDRRFLAILISDFTSAVGTGITIFAVPWFLIRQTWEPVTVGWGAASLEVANGQQLYGLAMIGVTLVTAFIAPWWGVWLDRHSRKRLLIGCEFYGFTTVSVFVVLGWIQGTQAWHYVALYVLAVLYFTTYYPTRFALLQQLFDRHQYARINGVMEVTTQTASVLTGAIAAVLIETVGFEVILIIDAATYLVGGLLLLTVPYTALPESTETRAVSPGRNLVDGLAFLRANPRLLVFLIASFMAFICVIPMNYLWPNHVQYTMDASVRVFAAGEVAFAVGAVFAGLLQPLIVRRFGPFAAILAASGLYTLAVFLKAWLLIPVVYVGLLLLVGWGNAGTRVARSTLIMELVPRHLIGRVNTVLSMVQKLFMILLVGSFTARIAREGTPFGFLLVTGLMALALVGLIATRRVLDVPPEAREQPV